MPKIPVTDNSAPMAPSKPREIEAICEGNKTFPSSLLQGEIKAGNAGSISCICRFTAGASIRGSQPDRTTNHVSFVGDCVNGRKITSAASSVKLKYLPSSTTPTTWTRDPSRFLKTLPTAFV